MEQIDVKKLLEVLKTGDGDEKTEAIEALDNMGPKAREAVPILIQAIQEDALCCKAVEALGNIGGKEAANALSKTLVEDSGVMVRIKAVLALKKLKKPDTIPALCKALKDRDEFVREGACYALGEIASKEAASDLREVLNDNVDFVRKGAAKALEKIGEQNTLKKQSERDPTESAEGNSKRETGKKPWWKFW